MHIPYIYCFALATLDYPQQIVQVGHACQESGHKFGCPENCHLILCKAKSQEGIKNIADHLTNHNINFVLFEDFDMYTSICTEPIYDRSMMKKFQLMK